MGWDLIRDRFFTAVKPRRCAPFSSVRKIAVMSTTAGFLLLDAFGSTPARAQQANQPGFDTRQAEKRFDGPQSDPASASRLRLPTPRLAQPDVHADTKPLFVLGHVSLTGAFALPGDRLVTAYQPYIGKKVSQADLAAMAAAVSDIYRAAGYHLSRAIVPPQDVQHGRLHLVVIEGAITEVALKGRAQNGSASGRCSIPFSPRGLRTLPRWSGSCC